MTRTILYAGCYTHDSDVAIRAYAADDPDGAITPIGEVTGEQHLSFLAVHGRRLYAVSETTEFDGRPGGGLLAFGICDDGTLDLIDRTSSHGEAPCFVSVTPDGRHVLVANYVSGSIAAIALEDDGRFGEVVGSRTHTGSGSHVRQEAPHAHCIRPSRDGSWAYAVDLGIDRVIRYSVGAGLPVVDELELAPASGPRHIVLHPARSLAYVIGELDNTIVTADVDETTGALTKRHVVSTLPDDVVGESIAAEIRVDPAGLRLYASNRGHDSIAVFDLADPAEPKPIGHVAGGGATPRNFAIHPSGRSLLVANQDSDSIARFALDADGGLPNNVGAAAELSSPVCLTYAEIDR